MSKTKNMAGAISKAVAECRPSEFFAQRLFDEGIDTPVGLTLRCEQINSITWKLIADHPLTAFYYTEAYWTERGMISKQSHASFEDKIISEMSEMTTQDMRNFVNGVRATLRNYKNVARLDMLFKFSNAHEKMASDLVESLKYDDNGKTADPIGFDEVFLRRAEGVGIQQDELEDAFAQEFEKLRQYQNVAMNYSTREPTPRERILGIMRQGFSNRSVPEIRSVFGGNYRNMNTFYGAIFKDLPVFHGCIWGAKPLATDLMLGNWNYKSSVTPTMLSNDSIPASLRIGYKGKDANALVETPVFGERQKIIHIAELKNGRTSITMTPETRAFKERIKKAA